MKIETTARHEGNTEVKRVTFSQDSKVASKIASLLTKSQYTKSYSPVRELWLNARENEQLTIEKTGSVPKKTELVIPATAVSSFRFDIVEREKGANGSIVPESESNTDNESFIWGEQTYNLNLDFSQHFSIRNYGLSMTSEEAVDRLGMIGSSSKADSNSFGGGMGIGSLSPLYITDRVLFENFHDGEVTYIVFFRDENGVISYEEPYSEDTDEEDGLRVSFDVGNGHYFDDDLAQMFFFAGKGERVSVVAPESFINRMRALDKEYLWFNDDSVVRRGWNALYRRTTLRRHHSYFDDCVLIDGCRYSSQTGSARRRGGDFFVFYNAPVGALEPSTSRELALIPEEFNEKMAEELKRSYGEFFDSSFNFLLSDNDLTLNRPSEVISSIQKSVDYLRGFITNEKIVGDLTARKMVDSTLSIDLNAGKDFYPFKTDFLGESLLFFTENHSSDLRVKRIHDDSVFIMNRDRRVVRNELFAAMDFISRNIRIQILGGKKILDAVSAIRNDGKNFPKIQIHSTKKVVGRSTADVKLNKNPSDLFVDWSDIDDGLKSLRKYLREQGFIATKNSSSRSRSNPEGPELEWIVGDGLTAMTTAEAARCFIDKDDESSEDNRVLLVEKSLSINELRRLPFFGEYLQDVFGYRLIGAMSASNHSIDRAANRLIDDGHEVYVLNSFIDIIGDESDYVDYVEEKIREADIETAFYDPSTSFFTDQSAASRLNENLSVINRRRRKVIEARFVAERLVSSMTDFKRLLESEALTDQDRKSILATLGVTLGVEQFASINEESMKEIV